MKKHAKKNTLEQTLYHSFLLLSGFLLFLSLSLTLYFDLYRQRKDMDSVISGVAAYIATLPEITEMIEQGYPSSSTRQMLDSLCNKIPNISVVTIYDHQGLRFYHTDRTRTGESYVAGDETAILNGAAPYLTTGYGTHGNQRRAFHAITRSDGEILGYVMASVFTETISAKHRYIFYVHIGIFLLMIVVSISFSNTFWIYLKRFLMGFEPDELVHQYLRQDAVINSFSEGILAADRTGCIIFSNETARLLLSPQKESLNGKSLADFYPQTEIEQILKTGKSTARRSFPLGTHTLLVTETPLRSSRKQEIEGILVLLYDQTEMLHLSDELSGAKNMLDTLRAFNHEFMNKLHIILGYLQTNETQKAIAFIINSNLVSSQSIRDTASCIRVSRICALIIGKMMHAAELGIVLSVTPDSTCLESNLLLPIEAYITMIGNLLENAIEELEHTDAETKEIILGLYCQPDCTILSCEDTGNGIRPDLISHLFERNVSSKGENRGTGLYLIHQILSQYHGEISIDTEPKEGTCFTLTFTRKEQTPCIM